MSTPLSFWNRPVRLLEVVHGVHGGISLGIASETDEAKATATVGIAVLDDGL